MAGLDSSGNGTPPPPYYWVCRHPTEFPYIERFPFRTLDVAKAQATRQLKNLSSPFWVACIYDARGHLLATRQNSGAGRWTKVAPTPIDLLCESVSCDLTTIAANSAAEPSETNLASLSVNGVSPMSPS